MPTFLKTYLSVSLIALVVGQTAFAQTHTLQVQITGDGRGVVRDCQAAERCAGDRIACGAQCLALFRDGETVLLKALPDADAAFGGWLVNGAAPASQEIQMTQDVIVTVTFTRQADVEPPVVTVRVDREDLRLGDALSITTTAADNRQVTEFQVTVNGVAIATTPGIATYTPTVSGVSTVTAGARDAAGHTTTATQHVWVRGDSMTAALFEGVDVERGVSHRDLDNVTLLPGDMNAIRTIVLPSDTELFAFPPAADFWFSYRDRAIVMVPTPAAALAVLPNTPYETVTAAALAGATCVSDLAGVVVGPADTVLVKTAEGGWAKVGQLQTNAAAWTIQFACAMLTP